MQSIGVVPVDVQSLGISILAAGCHKGLLVPQGLGIFYCNRDLRELDPAYLALASLAHPPSDLIARPDALATHSDARRFEIGNYNLANFYALGASLDLVCGIGMEKIVEHVLNLGDRLIAHMDQQGIRIVGPRACDHRSHIYVLDLPGAGWPEYLAKNKVRILSVRDGIRISFAMFNIEDEVDQLAEIIRRKNSS